MGGFLNIDKRKYRNIIVCFVDIIVYYWLSFYDINLVIIYSSYN